MVDFRKWFPALAVVALAFGAASTANAQAAPPFTCDANAGVPPIVRAEGITELVGDLVLRCKGGVPTAVGTAVPKTNIQIFLNTNITSKLTSGVYSEALLMLDEPTPLQQRYCTFVLGGCTIASGVGVGTGSDGLADGIDYDTDDVPNVFQGQQSGPNVISWLGVPIDPPGTTSERVIRITNVRSDARSLGVSSTLIPTQIVMFISVNSSTQMAIDNPQQTVAYVQPGFSFSTRKTKSSYLQCVSWNSAASTNTAATLADGAGTFLRYVEGFASSFKRRNTALGTVDTSPVPTDQNIPGDPYNTESGFYNVSPVIWGGSNTNVERAGLADHGTRLMARFAGVPAGVALYTSVYATGVCLGSDSNCAAGTATPVPGSRARLVNTDSNGGGSFSATIATNAYGAVPTAPVSLNNGSGTAVWEILDAQPNTIEAFEFGVAVSYTANTSNNLPGLGSATVAGSFAPLSTVTTASSSAPIPRFDNRNISDTIFTINACTTNLLFVFLTNQAGFDSGIAISNTSVDPFGTAPQSGPCKLNYYGETAGGGAAPAAQTSAVVPAGKQLTAVLSTGGNYGIAATPGFQGYMIAQCQFQYAHGFAFISDVGANRVSEAYLALILDSALPARTLFQSEILGH